MANWKPYDERNGVIYPGTGKYAYSYITEEKLKTVNVGAMEMSTGFAPSSINANMYLMNAVDINWAGVKIDGTEIKTAGHLGYLISNHGGSNTFTNSIPVMNSTQIDNALKTGNLPDNYISIPTADEIEQSYIPTTYNTTNNDAEKYLNVIFTQISALQQKVQELEDLKEYGVHSYNDKVTTMSVVANSLQDTTETEPLWATDENTLGIVTSNFSISRDCVALKPIQNAILGTSYFDVNSYGVTWNDALSGNGEFELFSHEDHFYTKEYVFITASNLNIEFELQNIDSEIADTKKINLATLNNTGAAADKYNIMLVVNRSSYENTYNSTTYYGDNFVWCQIADYTTLIDVTEGFWNEQQNVLTNDKVVIGTQNRARYYIKNVNLNNTKLFKFDTYGRYQDFTNTVQPIPSDNSNKGTVAHITIRSVTTDDMLNEIKNDLSANELIYVEHTNTLKIKNREGLIKTLLGGGSDNPLTDTGMTQQEIFNWLTKNGIVLESATDITAGDGIVNTHLRLAPIADVTFVNQSTNKTFKYTPQSDGTLRATELGHRTLAERINNVANTNVAFKRYIEAGNASDGDTGLNDASMDGKNWTDSTGSTAPLKSHIRGFVGTLQLAESNPTTDITSGPDSITSDAKLNSDRIMIANVYMPETGISSHACTHRYIELSNTSDKDFELDGCYIHICKQHMNGNLPASDVYEKSLALTGYVPANGTYLIRACKYAESNGANVFINVDTYDQEWYDNNHELVNFDTCDNNTILLTYGCAGKDIVSTSNFAWNTASLVFNYSDSSHKSSQYSIHYIDSTSIKAPIVAANGGLSGYLDSKNGSVAYQHAGHDCLYKITFELDPAKQAFQSLFIDAKDSSRTRNNKDTDLQTVVLDSGYIEFPKTSDQNKEYTRFPVSNYTPHASFENKNVLTDKTKFDTQHPNMVTVGFGKNMATTRCFNWISGGLFDEYIWLRKKGDTTWSRFETYKNGVYNDSIVSGSGLSRKEFGYFLNGDNIIQSVQSVVYDRITNYFPGSDLKDDNKNHIDGTGIIYTSHKCILTIPEVTNNSTQEYEYIVGRADIQGNPDVNHISETMGFTMRPSTSKIRIYQTTDQQGFNWVEYQYWAACANKLNDIIAQDLIADPNIIPVLINTGDMSQNGTRINEWLDYYNAGKSLFNHLEQVTCVGNNDLMDVNINKLGTGDDSGKSNPYFFHLAYCYEVDSHNMLYKITDNNTTTTPNVDDVNNDKYYLTDVNKTHYDKVILTKIIKLNDAFNAYGDVYIVNSAYTAKLNDIKTIPQYIVTTDTVGNSTTHYYKGIVDQNNNIIAYDDTDTWSPAVTNNGTIIDAHTKMDGISVVGLYIINSAYTTAHAELNAIPQYIVTTNIQPNISTKYYQYYTISGASSPTYNLVTEINANNAFDISKLSTYYIVANNAYHKISETLYTRNIDNTYNAVKIPSTVKDTFITYYVKYNDGVNDVYVVSSTIMYEFNGSSFINITIKPLKTIEENINELTTYFVKSSTSYILNTDNEKKIVPIISVAGNNTKYVPSFYYTGIGNRYILMFNTELTTICCGSWFNLNYTDTKYRNLDVNATYDSTIRYYKVNPIKTNEYLDVTSTINANTFITDKSLLFVQVNTTLPVNAYTGFTIGKIDGKNVYVDKFETIYTMLYDMIFRISEDANASIPNSTKKPLASNIIFACHEMPFTVITNDNVTFSATSVTPPKNEDRSISNGSLVGCHCNLIDPIDAGETPGINWLSRLCEYMKLRVFIGGHKHTYMCTNKLRELYTYNKENDTTAYQNANSLTDGPMIMQHTLVSDTAKWRVTVDSLDGMRFYLNQDVVNLTNMYQNPYFQTTTGNNQGTDIVGSITLCGSTEYDEVTLVDGSYVWKYVDKHVGETVGTVVTKPLYHTVINSTKFPIMVCADDIDRATAYKTLNGLIFNTMYNLQTQNPFLYPYYGVVVDNYSDNNIIYAMCQATGFKIKSNKELPTDKQRFSMIIPKTTSTATADKPDANQQYAMYSKIYFDNDDKKLELVRFKNITSTTKLLSQTVYGTAPIVLEYMVHSYTHFNTTTQQNEVITSIFGNWLASTDDLHEADLWLFKF